MAVALNLREPEVTKLYRGYWKLRGLDKLNTIHKETNGKLWPVWKLYQQLVKKRRMSIDQVIHVVEIAIHKLPHMESLYKQAKDEVDKMQRTRQVLVPHMESLYKQAKDEVDKMQRTRQVLANDIAWLERKISILDNIVLSSEQECKRTEQ